MTGAATGVNGDAASAQLAAKIELENNELKTKASVQVYQNHDQWHNQYGKAGRSIDDLKNKFNGLAFYEIFKLGNLKLTDEAIPYRYISLPNGKELDFVHFILIGQQAMNAELKGGFFPETWAKTLGYAIETGQSVTGYGDS